MPVPNQPTRAHVLAFDTSTEQLSAAVNGPSGPLTVVVPGGAAASAALLPQVQRLLEQAQLRYADLAAVAFGRGPGAFTGLRTSCAVAQGLSLGLGVPVLPIDSLLIVAEDARTQLNAFPNFLAKHAAQDAFDVAVAMDARMQEAYAAAYRWQQGSWSVLLAPALYTQAALSEALQAQAWHAVAGSALGAFGQAITWPAGAVCVAQEHDRAGALLRLALSAFAAGKAVDADQALPLYLRDKVAQTSAEREALRAAA
jgi:tRNA threonylcarbamoyladenosine biosynthesis protein TsaB